MKGPAERLADAIAAGDSASLAFVLDALRRDDGRVARSLGLAQPGRPRADRERDALIVQLRGMYPNASDAEAARAIAAAWLRYETTAWRADRLHREPPYPGCTPRGVLWRLLRAGHGAPSAETIRRRLRAGQKRA